MYKSEYIELQIQYISELTKLSLNIKELVIGKDKQNYLFKELIKLNEWLEKTVRKQASQIHTIETKAKFVGGIVFPFKYGDDMNPYVILGCIPELAIIFETKVRAPYKIVFEVCRLSELIEEVEQQMREVDDVKLDEDDA